MVPLFLMVNVKGNSVTEESSTGLLYLNFFAHTSAHNRFCHQTPNYSCHSNLPY